jgi:hypothetical protein
VPCRFGPVRPPAGASNPMKRAASSIRHLVREGEPELPPGMGAAPSSGAPNLGQEAARSALSNCVTLPRNLAVTSKDTFADTFERLAYDSCSSYRYCRSWALMTMSRTATGSSPQFEVPALKLHLEAEPGRYLRAQFVGQRHHQP